MHGSRRHLLLTSCLHNSDECSVSQKPLVTYVATELKDHLYQNTVSINWTYVDPRKPFEKINFLYDETKNNLQKKIHNYS